MKMEYLEIGLLAAAVILLVILLVVSLRKKTSGGGNELAALQKQFEYMQQNQENQNKLLMDQAVRQNESMVKQMALLGENLQASQERQQLKSQDILRIIANEMNGMRKENQQSLDKINQVVTEKMQQTMDTKLNQTSETMVKNIAELGRNLELRQEAQKKATAEQLVRLEGEFEKIRTQMLTTLESIRSANTEQLEKLRRDNAESMDKINNTVNEKLQKTLDDRISKSFEAVNKRLAEVYEGLGEMRNVASGVNDLKNVLSNVKTRGVLGEIQLSTILSEILAPEQYGEQVTLVPRSSERVDFAVKLPGARDGESIYLPIDSKFPGDSYANLLAAYESGDPVQLKLRRAALEAEIKRCAKSIHDKYIVPPYTTDFAIMFLPFEGLYAEVINMGLVEKLQRDYKVNIAGPSTMAAMLNSLQMGFRTLAIQKKSGEVWKILEAAKKEFSSFEVVLESARNRLRQADDDLEKLIGTRTRAINKKLLTVSALSSKEEAAKLLDEA